jgi:hypothetical protein
MPLENKKTLIPAFTTFISFVVLACCTLLTSPAKNITYIAVFFTSLLVFLASFFYLIITIRVGYVSAKNRYKIFSLSVFLMLILMFRSAQSLGTVDILVLVLIIFGLFFYISKRASN